MSGNVLDLGKSHCCLYGDRHSSEILFQQWPGLVTMRFEVSQKKQWAGLPA